MSETIIKLTKLTKIYDRVHAVDSLSLSIKKGEIFGLLGPNGAGKSTTILMMLGLSEPTSGDVTVCGINSTKHPIEVKKRVGYLPDDLGFYQQMSGSENLIYTGQLNGMTKQEAKERAHRLLEQVGLSEAAHKKTGKYSRGMKQRLGLADVLMKKPEVIILDEPTLGIDPEGVRDILKLIKQLNIDEKITVLLSSHHLHQVQQICDRVGIFVKGKLLASGNVEQLATQLFFKDSYVIHIEGSPLTEELVTSLKQLKDVNQIEQVTDTKCDIYCQRDMTSVLVKHMVENNVELTHISRKDYGLDEIYHRYFEGRDSFEKA